MGRRRRGDWGLERGVGSGYSGLRTAVEPTLSSVYEEAGSMGRGLFPTEDRGLCVFGGEYRTPSGRHASSETHPDFTGAYGITDTRRQRFHRPNRSRLMIFSASPVPAGGSGWPRAVLPLRLASAWTKSARSCSPCTGRRPWTPTSRSGCWACCSRSTPTAPPGRNDSRLWRCTHELSRAGSCSLSTTSPRLASRHGPSPRRPESGPRAPPRSAALPCRAAAPSCHPAPGVQPETASTPNHLPLVVAEIPMRTRRHHSRRGDEGSRPSAARPRWGGLVGAPLDRVIMGSP